MARKKTNNDKPKPTPSDCCHGPCAMVWLETHSEAVFVENQEVRTVQLGVRADVANIATPPPGQVVTQDGASDSKLETVVTKNQGKVYRTDRYTVHWRAEGACRPLRVALRLAGAVSYENDGLPPDGSLTLSRSHLLEPPDYAPTGASEVTAELSVVDCTGSTSTCRNRVERP